MIKIDSIIADIILKIGECPGQASRGKSEGWLARLKHCMTRCEGFISFRSSSKLTDKFVELKAQIAAVMKDIEGGRLQVPLPIHGVPEVCVPTDGAALQHPVGGNSVNLGDADVAYVQGCAPLSSMDNYGCFAKLPNPMLCIVNSVGPFADLDAETIYRVCRLLVLLVDQARILAVPDVVVLQVLSLRVSGSLANVVLRALHEMSSVRSFHQSLLDTYVPARVCSRLLQKYFYRPQRYAESLSDFYYEVRLCYRALRLSFHESYVVSVIVSALNPETRSRLLYTKEPVSFADIEGLAARVLEVQCVDQVRQQAGVEGASPLFSGVHSADEVNVRRGRRQAGYGVSTLGGNVEGVLPNRGVRAQRCGAVPSREQVVYAVSPTRPVRRNIMTCFQCGREGHVRRFCPDRPPLSGSGGVEPRRRRPLRDL